MSFDGLMDIFVLKINFLIKRSLSRDEKPSYVYQVSYKYYMSFNLLHLN